MNANYRIRTSVIAEAFSRALLVLLAFVLFLACAPLQEDRIKIQDAKYDMRLATSQVGLSYSPLVGLEKGISIEEVEDRIGRCTFSVGHGPFVDAYFLSRDVIVTFDSRGRLVSVEISRLPSERTSSARMPVCPVPSRDSSATTQTTRSDAVSIRIVTPATNEGR